MINYSEKDLARFWSKVAVGGDDECWEWQAARVNGYGSFSIGTKKIPASRFSCLVGHGEPNQGWNHALHSCDNPPCCNPKHLRWGTQKHNVEDMISRGRESKPPVNYPGRHTGKMPKGETLHNNSLTESIAREIMSLHMAHRNVTEIATAVGKPKHVVADVCRGRSWRHLEGIPSLEELKSGGVRRGVNQFS